MALGEFDAQVGRVLDLLDKGISISRNQGKDDLDLSTLDVEATSLAEQSFTGVGRYTAAGQIAYKEAFDFVTSHSRAAAMIEHDRAHYYEASVAEAQADIARQRYTVAVLRNMASFAGKQGG